MNPLITKKSSTPNHPGARMAGIRTTRILAGHVLPGAAVQALIAATLGLGDTILGLAGLSFLGLGVQPPTAEWGSMLNDYQGSVLRGQAYLIAFPSLALVITALAINLVGDGIRDALDPRQR